jgi:hypothetical protein
MRPKTLPRDFEQPTSAFRVRPDWYEEYWLAPKKTSQPAATKWRRSMFRLHFHLYAVAVSGVAAFSQPNRGRFEASLIWSNGRDHGVEWATHRWR